MKLSLAFLSAAFAVTSATSISSKSKMGKTLMSKARRVEDGQADAEWMTDYSLQFTGCHHVSQWNSEADGEDEARVSTMRLAKFRLCPTNSCSTGGCSAGYGNYIVDLDEFLASYLENKQEQQEAQCEDLKENTCSCDNDDGNDNFDEDECYNTCYENNNMSDCIEQENDQYYEADAEAGDYIGCAAYNPNGRRLEDGGNGDDDVEFYMGAYCAAQGGQVKLGLFTDDSCTEFDGGDYLSAYGTNAQYDGNTNLIDQECWSCAEEAGQDEYYNAQYEVNEMCETVYEEAGKCETNLNTGEYYQELNENACSYIEGIQTTTASGIINGGSAGGNGVATAFIWMFTTSFVLLGSYVYYLKTKLDRGRINLSD